MRAQRARAHEELIVWQRSIDLVQQVNEITGRFPLAERAEFRRFVSIARGSLKELETLMVVAERLGMACSTDLFSARSLADEVSRMLTALRKRLT
jgi:hypothetical protein